MGCQSSVAISTISLLLLLSLHTEVQAETKTIVSEATYSMGDGETPSFAEAMVLQKAKQRALEEAGTYVESYTQVRNLDLTMDEIKTVAGGVMKTEIVDQNRKLEGNGTRFYVKIKALVTTDAIEDIARRKQLAPLSAENKRLQNDVANLTKDLEALKVEILRSKTEIEREVVLEKLRTVEKQFRQVRSTEASLYQRLVSGEELSLQAEKAFREEERRRDIELKRRERQRETLEKVLTTLRSNGHTIAIGSPETNVSLERPDIVELGFVVTAAASEEARFVIHDLHQAYNSELPDDAARQIDEVLDRLTIVLTVSLLDGREYVSSPTRLHNYKSALSYQLNQLVKNEPTVVNITVPIPRNLVNQVASVAGKFEVTNKPTSSQQAMKRGLTEDLNRELDEELKKLQAVLDVPGIAPTFGTKAYLRGVQQRINSFWNAPPVDVTDQTYVVVVKFRVHRNGSVTGVGIERSSGKEYYDLAGRRAVLSAVPLPPFPSELTKAYLDAHFTFTVGKER
jgi:TonB family protein